MYCAVLLAFFFCTPAFGQDIDSERSDLVKRWSSDGIVTPAEVDTKAAVIFGKPVSSQLVSELKTLAKNANLAANLVDFITDRYHTYYRSKSHLTYLQEDFLPYHDNFAEVSSRMRKYRNLAYYNLGLIAKEEGKITLAFFSFEMPFVSASSLPKRTMAKASALTLNNR